MPSVISFKRPSPSPTATAAVVPTVPAAAKTVVAEPTPAPAAVAETQPTPTAAPAQTVATTNSNLQIEALSDDEYSGVGGFEGEFSAKDMRVPYLSICGPSSESFKTDPSLLGQFIFNKVIPLGAQIRVIFCRATKRYVEDLPFGSPTEPRRANTRADYLAMGLTDSQMKDVADLDLLIEFPGDTEGIDEMADLFVGDKAYLLARYTVQSTAYGKTVPLLMGDMKGFLKGNLVNGYYDVEPAKGAGKNLYFYPVLKAAGPTSIELRRAIVARVAPPVANAA
jgi:hypothetical protein